MFSTLAHALAQTGLVSTSAAKAEGDRITRAEAREAREARMEAGKRRKAQKVARAVAQDRRQFEAREGLDCDEIVKVSGVWMWRTGRHMGKPVGAKALAKRGVTPRR